MQVIVDLLSCLFLSAVPATFNYFLDYCLGHPMSDNPSTKAIFFSYSYWLAKRNVPSTVERNLVNHFAPMLNSDDPDTRRQGQEALQLSMMAEGKKHFFYEQAIGMCPFCTNFWISLITAFILFNTTPLSFLNTIIFFLVIPIFSHTILRKL